MSTINFKRITDWIKENQADIAIFFGFILMAFIGFIAGRISAPEIIRNPILIEEPALFDLDANISGSAKTGGAGEQIGLPNNTEGAKGIFIASKGGTKYHWPWCSYAQKIKEANQKWFNTEAEAQAAGYSPCGCISKQAPAGFK